MKTAEPIVSMIDADSGRHVYDSVAFEQANDKSMDFFAMLARKRRREQAEDMALMAYDPNPLPVMYETTFWPDATEHEIDTFARQVVDNLCASKRAMARARKANDAACTWQGIWKGSPSSLTYEHAAQARDRIDPAWRAKARAAGIEEAESAKRSTHTQPIRSMVKVVDGKVVLLSAPMPMQDAPKKRRTKKEELSMVPSGAKPIMRIIDGVPTLVWDGSGKAPTPKPTKGPTTAPRMVARFVGGRMQLVPA